MDNFTYFQICDDYLPELLKPENKMLFSDKIPQTIYPNIKDTPVVWSIIFNQLLVDGHIKEVFVIVNGENMSHYILTADGRVFIEEGGYNQYFLRKAKDNLLSLKILKVSKDANQSVIDTNIIQRRSIIATVIIILFSLFTQIQTCNISNMQLLQSKSQTQQLKVYLDTIPIKVFGQSKASDSTQKK